MEYRVTIALLIIAAVLAPTPALANGVDLQKTRGIVGEQIQVVGHDWLTYPSTPVQHVELHLLSGSERIILFDVPANSEGDISASFRVPNLTPGAYSLQACSWGPGTRENLICLPEGEFTVLAQALPVTGISTRGLGALALALVAIGMLMITSRSKFATSLSK